MIGLGFLAGAAQLVVLVVGRYAPYPDALERGRRGPIRSVLRRLLVPAQARRASETERSALES